MNTAQKGAVAEIKVAADLTAKGFRVFVALGTSGDYDLVIDRDGGLERIQVKYSMPTATSVIARCRTHSNTSKQQTHRAYTPDCFEWLAVYNPREDEIYYLPSSMMTKETIYLHLKKEPPKHFPNVNLTQNFKSI